MAILLAANNAQSTLATAISNTVLTIPLTPGSGVLFPQPTTGQYFKMTLTDAATQTLREIVHVTAVTGDSLTVVRGQEGTTALAWNAGDFAINMFTAGTFQALAQQQQAQAGQFNYAMDTGTPNAYVITLAPAPLSDIQAGMPIMFTANNPNPAGDSTLTVNGNTAPLINQGGGALYPNQITAGAIVEVYYVAASSAYVLAWSSTNLPYVAADSQTGSGILPAGTTAQRSASPAGGFIRYNTTLQTYEAYFPSTTSWGSLSNAQPLLAATPTSFKNLIVNGAMRVAQQYGNAAQNAVANGTWVIDQWKYAASVAGLFNAQQVAGPAALGFDSYLQFTSASAYTPASGDNNYLHQIIEAQNITALAWGTPNAKPISLQFVVNVSVAGTYSGSIRNIAGTRSYPFSFSVPQANTDTLITIPNIPGDQTGTWTLTGTAGALVVSFSLGCGANFLGAAGVWSSGNLIGATDATQISATNGATFKITGVQLEAAPFCTAFERPTPEAELLRCQRYLPSWVAPSSYDQLGSGFVYSATRFVFSVNFVAPARVPPTGVAVSALSHLSVNYGGTYVSPSAVAFNLAGTRGGRVYATVSGATVGYGGDVYLYGSGSTARFLFTGAQL
jgi:hypothetical protein